MYDSNVKMAGICQMNCLLESSRSRKNVTLDSNLIYESMRIVLIFCTQIKYDFITLNTNTRPVLLYAFTYTTFKEVSQKRFITTKPVHLHI